MSAEGYGGGEGDTGGAAPTSSTFILQQPDAALPNAEALSTLATGLLKSTTGVVSRAVPGTDYQTPLVADSDYATPASVPGKSEAYWCALAAKKFGVSPKQIFSLFEDFENGAGIRLTTSGTQAGLGCPSLDGSWASWSVGNGTLTGRVQILRTLVNAQVPIHFANPQAGMWMMVSRGKVTTTPGATCRATLGNGSFNITAGINKSQSATKFCANTGVATILSTGSIDTNVHEVMWRNDPVGGHSFLSVDGEAEVQGGAAQATAADQFGFDFFTGAGEAQQILQIDYLGLIMVRS